MLEKNAKVPLKKNLRESNYEYSILNSKLFKGSRDVLERVKLAYYVEKD